MTSHSDPVGTGFVASLARPGGNITGLSTLAPELDGKRLELLKETVLKLSRVAVIGRSAEPGYAQLTKDLDLAAAVLNMKLQHLDLPDPKEPETAFRAASKGRADAVLPGGSPGNSKIGSMGSRAPMGLKYQIAVVLPASTTSTL